MKLHIGCETHFLVDLGWTDCDIAPRAPHVVQLDARERLPFEDGSCSHVFHAHLLEHMTYAHGCAFLAECYRVLEPGGRLRVTTPDLSWLTKMHAGGMSWLDMQYLDSQPPEFRTPCRLINRFVREWGHLFIWDEPTLKEALLASGFERPTEQDCLNSADPALVGLENVARLAAGFYQLESMTLEASRP